MRDYNRISGWHFMGQMCHTFWMASSLAVGRINFNLLQLRIVVARGQSWLNYIRLNIKL